MLESISDIGQGKIFPPESDRSRVEAIRANRKLYNGDFSPLAIDVESDTVLRKINWFRRVCTFYSQFLYGNKPTVTLQGNARFDALYAASIQSILDCMFYANIDLLRYGTAVVAASPFDPVRLCVYEPDAWFIIRDMEENITADILAYTMNPHVFGNQRFAKIIYSYEGDRTSVNYEVFKSNHDGVGELILSQSYPDRVGRQVLPFFSGYAQPDQGTSMFDDMRPSVAEIVALLSRLSNTIKRNLRPHLYGPDNILSRDESGKASLDIKGMFLPLQDGDQIPGYLQWDAKIEAVEKDYNFHLDSVFFMTGLSRTLFEPGFGSGTISGSSLQRFLIPFIASLNTLRESNRLEIIELLILLNRNRASMGLEIVSLDPANIQVEWAYENLFQDQDPEQEQANGNE